MNFELVAQGPYALSASSDFLCGFTPASGASAYSRGELQLGFLLEPTFEPVVVSLTQRGQRVLVECAHSLDQQSLAQQLARMLSLDRDATGFAGLAQRDAVLAAALAERPGFRPVCFPSAYEAAVWGVLAQRTPMRVAAQLKLRLAERCGGLRQHDGREFIAAPPPARLLELTQAPGVPRLKLERLQGIARAALAGKLDTEQLRARERVEAIAALSTLAGVGLWTAELIFMRGCGVSDELTASEPRVFEAVGEAYGLGRAASAAELCELAQGWRPYRSWVSVLLVSRFMRASRAA
jgi:DNA-3-methyladenine glycosylase II